MPTDCLYVVKLAADSGLAKDNVVNTFAITSTGDQTPDVEDICLALNEFYNHDNGPGEELAHYMSPSLSRVTNACEINVFDLTGNLDGSAHGSPFFTYTWTLGPAATAEKPLPSECAVVISLLGKDWATVAEEGTTDPNIPTPKAAQNMGAPAVHVGTTKPRARMRGRIYLGPLNVAALANYDTSDARVHPDMVSACAGGLQVLADTLPQLASVSRLGVWSRRNADIVPLSGITGETIGFVDNAFDTQRRRGEAATSRTTVASA